eukprot:TRINITY_DN3987_c0_g1_i1.p1 TRINITY_DN3987_c0_g1~~TRINITY_DN3987_c0_g1_i1.p1  ORF type:complete len:942 (-),score=263.04 TRINITY_DN3987_c0_g1_i1:145-2970(-)
MGKYTYNGLTKSEVEKSRKTHGANKLPPPEVETFWDKLLENFEDPLIKILAVALVITTMLAFFGYAHWSEGAGIALAVFLATFVATYSEFKNEESFRDLQEEASRAKNNVFRDGKVQNLVVTEIVVGDYVLLQGGDKVPADGPMLEGFLHASQASLTGEPEPLRKTPNSKKNSDKRELTNPHYMFRGSLIEDGEGVMLVEAIGAQTVYGSILADINEDEERQSPLEVKLSNLADGISFIGYVGASFIFLSFLFKQFVMDQGYSYSNTIEYVMNWQVALQDSITALILSIIIIVVAVPEGLPMMIAIVLSLNMQKLLNKQVLVRKLLGIETAGSLNVLFSDKTGTITRGHLEVNTVVASDLYQYDEPEDMPTPYKNLVYFSLKHSVNAHLDKDCQVVGGNSSDRAFMQMLPNAYLQQDEAIERVDEVVFSSAKKFSAVTLKVSNTSTSRDFPKGFFSNDQITIVKGAPEIIMSRCTAAYDSTDGVVSNITDRKKLTEFVDDLSRTGVRVIALATSPKSLAPHQEDCPEGLTFLGFIGLSDQVRDESAHAISTCQAAGIQVVMITGDRKETAIAIAREVNLLPPTASEHEKSSDTHLPRNSVLTSDQLHVMGDDEVIAILPEIRVIARALPVDKSRLVKLAQSQDLVVGMTGDGVNDAAALNRADVGFAMGSGTEMAKEAADIVIMNDNINSIVYAVLYGRTIFRSIRRFIIFQSTINVASTLIVFLGPFLGFDFPLTLIQLLWVNLVMDTLAALAFGGEPALARYMSSPPIKRDEAIVNPYMWSSIAFNGLFVSFCSIIFLVWDEVPKLFVRDGVLDDAVFLTAFFAFFIFITTINAFNVRTQSVNIFDALSQNVGFLLVILIIFVVQITFTHLPALGPILRTVPLTANEWAMIIVACFIIIPFDTVRKLLVAPWLPDAIIDTSGLNQEPLELSAHSDKKEL